VSLTVPSSLFARDEEHVEQEFPVWPGAAISGSQFPTP